MIFQLQESVGMALAYIQYKGNILPPMFHWAKAAYPPDEIGSPIALDFLNSVIFHKRVLRSGAREWSIWHL